MEVRVEQFISNKQLLIKKDRILIAVSGGPDSMALLHLLAQLRRKWDWQLYVLHVNHQLRGEESEEDARLVEDQCLVHDIPYMEKRIDVSRFKAAEQVGTQVAARKLRYGAFEAEMNRVGAEVLVTGHHGDDEAETVFMKMARGTTPFSKLGISHSRPFAGGMLVRPLLSETKDEIVAYCKKHEIPFRTDSSNLSDTYVRNRFRQQVMPSLKAENPLLHKQIRRYDEWQEEDNQFLLGLARERMNEVILEKKPDLVTISKESFQVIPFPLQRRMIHLILNYLYGSNTMRDFSVYIEQIEAFFLLDSGFAQMDLRNGVKVIRSYERYMFTQEPSVESVEYCLKLTAPGSVGTPLGELRADFCRSTTGRTDDEAFFRLSDLAFPLYIRNRESGDKLHPIGLDGSKKVNRVFIDKKVERPLRDKWPMLVDSNGTILWMPLLLKSRIACSAEESGKLLRVTFSKNHRCH